MRSADTSREAREVQLTALRALRPDQRLAMALEMSEFARCVTLAGIAYRNPELTSVERAHELSTLLRAASGHDDRTRPAIAEE